MAITKLMHMKEAKGSNKAIHLKNGIKYILNEEKTEGGLFVGGIGNQWNDVYDTFLETKKKWNKEDGRQGYHFVVSFPPGQIDKETMCRVMAAFCDELLKSSYEYVWAIHTDTEHLHGHVIFNSVARDTGMKYHYSNGDWEKIIQPITDQVCLKYGLPMLEATLDRKNKDYGEWKKEQTGCLNRRDLIRSDIDECILEAECIEDVWKGLEEMGYQIKAGSSEKHGVYYTILPPESSKGFRSYTLGRGYHIEEIQRRVKMKGTTIQKAVLRRSRPMSAWRFRKYYITNPQLSRIRKHYTSEVLWNYQKGGKYKDRAAISRIVEECDWMARCGIGKENSSENYLDILQYQEEELKRELRQCYIDLKNSAESISTEEEKYTERQENLKKVQEKLRIIYKEKKMAQNIREKLYKC